MVEIKGAARNLLLADVPETAVAPDPRAGKWGLLVRRTKSTAGNFF
jgi:hypothetical protein